MRAVATSIIVSMGGLVVISGPCQAQKMSERNEAMRPRPVHELPAGKTDKLSPAQWAHVDAQRKAAVPDVRPLGAKEMGALRGRRETPIAFNRRSG
jgi:hypothetical protein